MGGLWPLCPCGRGVGVRADREVLTDPCVGGRQAQRKGGRSCGAMAGAWVWPVRRVPLSQGGGARRGPCGGSAAGVAAGSSAGGTVTCMCWPAHAFGRVRLIVRRCAGNGRASRRACMAGGGCTVCVEWSIAGGLGQHPAHEGAGVCLSGYELLLGVARGVDLAAQGLLCGLLVGQIGARPPLPQPLPRKGGGEVGFSFWPGGGGGGFQPLSPCGRGVGERGESQGLNGRRRRRSEMRRPGRGRHRA
jgi:hypothetical protein